METLEGNPKGYVSEKTMNIYNSYKCYPYYKSNNI